MTDVILLNNLFNGKYIKDKVGGEIINIYQSDNGKYYLYINPYGNIHKQWDNRIKDILFIRSVGNGIVKIIGKAEIEKQISLNAIHKKGEGIDESQKKYIDENNITYGNVKLYKLGSWSNYYVTFEAKSIFKAIGNIYLTTKEGYQKNDNTFILKNITRINNQSQKIYIESDKNKENYDILKDILSNPEHWEKQSVSKVDTTEQTKNSRSFLSIIKKENDEHVNSNLLAYYLKNDRTFWSDFITKVLKISEEDVINGAPEIIRESVGNIDLLIKVGKYAFIIENKIKSGINGKDIRGSSQLDKYISKSREYFKDQKDIQCYYYLLRPDYNNEHYQLISEGDRYKEIKYSEIFDIIKERSSNSHFEEFKRVVEKHSAEYDNDLFEVMNERFINQIRSNQ